ncbi:MAG: hypothetical protein QM695_11595 [Micropruina sp.]
MSGRAKARVLVAVGAMVLLIFGMSAPTVGQASAPVPQATTPAASPAPTPDSSPASTAEPGDEPADDGSNPTPDQTGTWVALGAAAVVAALAGLVVALRKR